MVSLIDIADQTKTVRVREKDVTVYGLSAADIALLLGRFPELRMIVSGRQADITPDMMIKMAPSAVAAAITAGTGHGGDEKHEAIAARLAAGDQLELLAVIFELTFPAGVGPFVQRLDALGMLKAAGSAAGGTAAATTSPAPSKT
jgi:hypothetical protein